jgi:prepilin-type processing-associated H-X9-DG protein
MTSDSEGGRAGVTVLELIVVIGCFTLILALLVPALAASRETARRLMCESNLKQIGIAMQIHESSHCQLPQGWRVIAGGAEGLGWAAELLPMIRHEQPIDASDPSLSLAIVSEAYQASAGVGLMRCPSDIATDAFDIHPGGSSVSSASYPFTVDRISRAEVSWPVTLPTSNYLGVYGTDEADDHYPIGNGDGPMIGGRSVRLADLIRGTSTTLLVGERTMRNLESTWLGVPFAGADAGCRLLGSALVAPNCDHCDECEFSSRHPGGAIFLWADGHVSMVQDHIERDVYQDLARRGR